MSDEAYARLTGLLLSEDESGENLYDREEVFDMMTYAILQGKLQLDHLSENLNWMLSHVFAKAGVREGMDSGHGLALLETYFEEHPPRADLLSLFLGAVQELAATPEETGRMRDRVATFLGRKRDLDFEKKESAKDGTPAGPMARFSLGQSLPKGSGQKTSGT